MSYSKKLSLLPLNPTVTHSGYKATRSQVWHCTLILGTSTDVYVNKNVCINKLFTSFSDLAGIAAKTYPNLNGINTL